MKTFATSVLYVASIVLAIGIGMTQIGMKYVSDGAAPCVSRINRSGGTCDKDPYLPGSCTATYYKSDSSFSKNAIANTSAGTTFDDCDSASTPCYSYYQHPLILSCEIE